MTHKRILAFFQPQAWLNDYAIDIDGRYKFDVTDQILAMGKEKALAIRDNDWNSDDLWEEHPISKERPHHGPFYVEVQQAIRDYFGE